MPQPMTSTPGGPSLNNALAESAGPTMGNVPAGGYIDNAVPFTHVRLRFDAAFHDNFPDRAEFFYAALSGSGANAHGPLNPERDVNYQEVSTYLELALSDRFSAFVEAPVRFIDPVVNDNTAGFSDMNAGFKWAFVAEQNQYFTFQFRTYIPTGDSERGLGNHHVSLEPGLLYFRRAGDVMCLGEVRDWIPIDGSDFAGNVVRYGAGLGYYLVESCNFSLIPIVECVGWTVVDGKKSTSQAQVVDASGDTIVNIKLGARLVFGGSGVPYGESSSLYVGWGHALTSEVWYEDLLRVEYRMLF